MIQLPDFERAWEYENAFYLTCDITRISKILAQWELFRMVWDVPGAIVECGVFKGASLARFAAFRQLVGNPFSKKIIGFDTFERYPETGFPNDKPFRERYEKYFTPFLKFGDFVYGAELLAFRINNKDKQLYYKACGSISDYPKAEE